MKQVEGATDRLLASIDFREYRGELSRIASESLHDPSAIDFAGLAEGLRRVPTFIKGIRRDWQRYVSAVSSAYISLCREVRNQDGTYARHCRSVDRETESGREFASAVDLKSLGSRPSRDDMSRLVATMSRLLSSYELRARYLARLVCISTGHSDDARWLMSKSTRQIEDMLRQREKGSWQGFVLGDEFILVHKAISRHGFRYLPERRMLTFSHGHASRPSYWQRTYSYAEFTAMGHPSRPVGLRLGAREGSGEGGNRGVPQGLVQIHRVLTHRRIVERADIVHVNRGGEPKVAILDGDGGSRMDGSVTKRQWASNSDRWQSLYLRVWGTLSLESKYPLQKRERLLRAWCCVRPPSVRQILTRFTRHSRPCSHDT